MTVPLSSESNRLQMIERNGTVTDLGEASKNDLAHRMVRLITNALT